MTMKQVQIKTDFEVKSFSATKVIFDDSDLVSVQVKCLFNEALIDTHFLFTFSVFNDLLRLSGQVGEDLQYMVSDKLLSNEPVPYIIELDSTRFVFTTCELSLSFLVADDCSCLSVENVKALSITEQAKNLKSNITFFRSAKLSTKQPQHAILNQLVDMYKYYEGLLELEVSEDYARSTAGLQNDFLYKLAYFAFQKVK